MIEDKSLSFKSGSINNDENQKNNNKMYACLPNQFNDYSKDEFLSFLENDIEFDFKLNYNDKNEQQFYFELNI